MATEKGRYANKREAAKDKAANATILGYRASELLSRDYADRKYLGINGPDSSTGGETKMKPLAERSAREISEQVGTRYEGVNGARYYLAADTFGLGVFLPTDPRNMPRVTKKSVNTPDTLPDERQKARKQRQEYDPTKGHPRDGRRRPYMGDTMAKINDRHAKRD